MPNAVNGGHPLDPPSSGWGYPAPWFADELKGYTNQDLSKKSIAGLVKTGAVCMELRMFLR
jgi:hypothetical protein